MVHHIYLIPGFFGFANIGDIKYFAHVRGQVERFLQHHGARAELHYVATLPTASLRHRIIRVLDTIEDTAGTGDGPIHLIGHSTGGLDARLLGSTGIALRSRHDVERITARIRSVVTIATPHFGTPLAAFFTSVLGQKILRALSIMTIHGIRLGSIPLPALLALAGALPRSPIPLPRAPITRQGPTVSLLDQVYRQVLRDFDGQRQQEIEAFFEATAADQALLPQLSPESMDVFNLTTRMRPGIRHGCVVSRARPPRLRTTLAVGLSPVGQAMYAIYQALHRVVATFPVHDIPPLTSVQSTALRGSFGSLPAATDNDAIVPTLSQVWGEVIHATWGDHLNIIGHFPDIVRPPQHVDWLGTRSGFARQHFECLWSDVVRYLLTTP